MLETPSEIHNYHHSLATDFATDRTFLMKFRATGLSVRFFSVKMPTEARKGALSLLPEPARNRPVCPYPQHAVYKGTGSTDLEENFVCR